MYLNVLNLGNLTNYIPLMILQGGMEREVVNSNVMVSVHGNLPQSRIMCIAGKPSKKRHGCLIILLVAPCECNRW